MLSLFGTGDEKEGNRERTEALGLATLKQSSVILRY